jgi:hypothetical protein
MRRQSGARPALVVLAFLAAGALTASAGTGGPIEARNIALIADFSEASG